MLLSEGNSTSAREAITILGLSGHIVEVCDPSPYCLARFPRFVQKFHCCPGMRDDPAGFMAFVQQLLAAGHFDVLLPSRDFCLRARQRELAGAGICSISEASGESSAKTSASKPYNG